MASGWLMNGMTKRTSLRFASFRSKELASLNPDESLPMKISIISRRSTGHRMGSSSCFPAIAPARPPYGPLALADGKPHGAPEQVKPDASTWSLGLTNLGALHVIKDAGSQEIRTGFLDLAAGKITADSVGAL